MIRVHSFHAAHKLPSTPSIYAPRVMCAPSYFIVFSRLCRRLASCVRHLLPALFLLACLGGAVRGAAPREDQILPSHARRSWGTRDGLPGNEVRSIVQDSSGALWLGTNAGLARFDGRLFEVFTVGPYASRMAAGVDIVGWTREHGLLVGLSDGGLLRRVKGRFELVPLPEGTAEGVVVQAFLRDREHVLWVALSNGSVLRENEGRLREVFRLEQEKGEETERITMVEDEEGAVWLARGDRVLRKEAGQFQPVQVDLVKRTELRLVASPKGGPWIISHHVLFKAEGGRVSKAAKLASTVGGSRLQAAVEDREGALWLGTRSRGLRRVVKGDVSVVLESPEDFSALYEDREGNVWAGANGGGLLRLSRGMLRCYNRGAGLMETMCVGGAEDVEGNIWLANRESGFGYLHKNRVRFAREMVDWAPLRVNAICPAPSGGVWVVCSRGLLRAWLRDNEMAWESVRADPLFHAVRVAHACARGDFWVVRPDGVLERLRDGLWTEFRLPGESAGGDPLVVADDSDGTVWVGTSLGRMYRLAGAGFVEVEMPEGLRCGRIQALRFGAGGVLWVGTSEAGLLRMRNGRFRVLDASLGLEDNNVCQLLLDDRESLWIGSPSGVRRVGLIEIERCLSGLWPCVTPTLIGPDEGAEDLSCLAGHNPGAWRTRAGMLWFTTRSGPVVIDPDREPDPQARPEARILGVRVDDAIFGNDEEVVIDTRARRVDFRFTARQVTKPSRVRIEYMLEGYDEQWLRAGASTGAVYSGLEPGKYRFVVRSHLSGAWSDLSQEALVLVVRPLWWQAAWFRVLAGLLAAAGFAVLVRVWSTRRLRARLAEVERHSALERERSRIARNLHDEVGAGLTRIRLLTQAVASAASNPQMNRIYEAANTLTRAMDEIVWAVNPKYDDLDGVAYYVGNYAQSFLADAGLRCRLLIPAALPQRHVSSASRHTLFLCCKEALNNVAKHAGAQVVTIEIVPSECTVSLSITDDGRGFGEAQRAGAGEPSLTARRGQGLENMKTRMQEVGGVFELSTVPGGGTRVSFTLPLHPEPISS